MFKYLRRCKRALLLGSLYMRLLGVAGTANRDITEFNRQLRLAQSPNALRFPGMIANSIWCNEATIEAIRYHIRAGKMEEAITLATLSIPRWLRYGRDLHGDLRVVMRAVARAS